MCLLSLRMSLLAKWKVTKLGIGAFGKENGVTPDVIIQGAKQAHPLN